MTDSARDMDVLNAGARRFGIELSLAQLAQFRRYYEELAEWNRRVNLTSITGWEEVQRRHFVDSLSVSIAIPEVIRECGSLADVGSGGGFPGLALKIAFPGLRITLIEATAKKTAFLSHMVETLEMSGVIVRTGRAEALAHEPDLREAFDVVTARALAPMNALAELTLPFCRIGGVVIAQKGHNIEDELREAERAIDTLGGKLSEVRQVELEGMDATGTLVVLEKVSPTPARYPRRPGMPAKNPL
ncbi:MAG: 16S rRNA (guanine(527)-N(7))-methyltransferase RsmG [Chloroflexi bacterium]|nr:16S rRNA (guanine(527)-N(7))-methyltransferase RsmG [Chloroflexota bacterium]